MPSTEGLVQQLDNLKPGLQRAVTAAAAVAQAGHPAGMAGRVLALSAFKGSASPLLCNEESGSGAGASHGLLACDSQLVQALHQTRSQACDQPLPQPRRLAQEESSRSSTVVMSDHALPCTQAESVLSGQAMSRRGLQGSLMYLHGGVAAHEQLHAVPCGQPCHCAVARTPQRCPRSPPAAAGCPLPRCTACQRSNNPLGSAHCSDADLEHARSTNTQSLPALATPVSDISLCCI